MKAKIKVYNDSVNAGLVTDANGRHYQFGKRDWKDGKSPPSNDASVTFEVEANARSM